MPRPVETDTRYVPGLDGIRAIAVMLVIAYHVGLPGAQGGMLGVGVFFTLSGYLITDLLLANWDAVGSLRLKTFWLYRARRLLPAVFLVLVAVSIGAALLDASQLAGVRRQVITAALYVANWSTIAQHGSYFARFAAPLPLDHLWSLSIEEQFYLAWPWLLWLGLRGIHNRRRLALAALGLAVVSAILMGQLHQPGTDPTRVYEGTDTRAFGLLIGAALAMILPLRTFRRTATPPPTDVLDGLGLAALLVIAVLVWRTNSFSSFLYPYGFLLLSVATALLVAAVICPGTRAGAALGWRPLRWIGVRSYGIYLWQWPIVVLADPSQTGFNLPRAAAEVAATVVIASLSWRFVEDPIRHGALARVLRQLPAAHRRRHFAAGTPLLQRVFAVTGGATALVLLAIAGLAGALPAASSGGGGPQRTAAAPAALAARASRTRSSDRGGRRAPPRPPTRARRTSCRSVVYIGDSTSEGSTSSDYIPNPKQRLQAQLAHFGVTNTIPEISGARSIVETFEGHPNAATVAQSHISGGYKGCWIIAMGTNDVDNVNSGANVGYTARIHRMMSIIGNQPTLWIDTITLLSSGPYSEHDMQRWNRALVTACRRYPSMRVYDWAAHAKRRWFIPDGIHYYTPGYIARTHLIAQALATAFPQGRPPLQSCVVP